jgi:hypothetical protein
MRGVGVEMEEIPIYLSKLVILADSLEIADERGMGYR